MVRVRVAPSPTGSPHVGTAYIAAINMLFAMANNGKMVLRIENTDKSRCNEKYEKEIFASLNWTGIKWDEGPDIGGSYGPYIQSARKEIYSDCIGSLIDKGFTYKCYCTQEDLMLAKSVNKKSGNFGYSGMCRNLMPEEIEENDKNNLRYVIRLKMPKSGHAEWNDAVKGKISFPYADVDDQILIKSDGNPTYHFANVVDDHYMRITHVFRGEEWISSTPKHLYLYKAFGWEKPEFGHLPLLLDTSGKKLSKRNSPTSIAYYKKIGIDPSALLNFLISISYNNDDQEIYNVEDLSSTFSINRINKSSAIFDIKKLYWMNKNRIAKEDFAEVKSKMLGWMEDSGIDQLIENAILRSSTVSDVLKLISSSLCGSPENYKNILNSTDEDLKSMYKESCIAFLNGVQDVEWSGNSIRDFAKEIAKDKNLDLKKHLIKPLFLSMYGSSTGLPVFKTMEVIGRDVVINRIKDFIKEL